MSQTETQEKPKTNPRYIDVRTFNYDQIEDLNKCIRENADKVADNGLLFFTDKIVVQLVENFNAGDWKDTVIGALRKSLTGLIAERMQHETTKRYFTGLGLANNALGAAPEFCRKCRERLDPATQTKEAIADGLQNNAADIDMVEKKIRYTKDLIEELEAGKWPY